jgi:chromate transporter
MLGEVARVFLKLGLIAFGGPAAHIAMMRDELVRRRRWLDDARFLDLLGMTNLIPGPNSTEMAIHLGYLRAGWPGLVVGGACFIVPAMLLVLGVAWAYVTYGALPEVAGALVGVKAVVIAIVAHALWMLGRAALRGPALAAVALGAIALYAIGVNELIVLFGGGAAVALARRRRRHEVAGAAAIAALGATAPAFAAAAGAVGLAALFLIFLKIGSVLYGSGYVLLAFLRNDFVNRRAWLTDRQLLDAVSVGQFTPGPVFTTATFIGYVLGGVPGALVATLGIFLPAFVFVAISYPLIPKLRGSRWAGAALDGVNAAALGLMAAVTWQLGRAAIVDGVTVALALLALGALVRLQLNSAWLVLGGAVIGFLRYALGR